MRNPFNNLKNIQKIPKKIIFLIILVLLGVAYYFYYTNSQKTSITYSKIEKSEIKTTVSASGALTGKKTANLKFKTAGKLSFLNIIENQQVQQGHTIAGLDTQSLNINLQQARNTLRDKQAIADKILDDVKDSAKDETYDERMKRTTAEAARDSAFDAVKEAERSFQDAVLVSPINGLVTQVNFVEGQNISVADTIAQVVDDSEIFFDAEVDESDIYQVSINNLAEISLNSEPNKVIKGNVAEILPYIKINSSGANVVVVRIKLDPSAIRFINNLNGQAEIISQIKTNVLVIPQQSLVEQKFVYIKTSKGYEKREVETGLVSDTKVEIVSGLDENQEVITNPEVINKKK